MKPITYTVVNAVRRPSRISVGAHRLGLMLAGTFLGFVALLLVIPHAPDPQPMLPGLLIVAAEASVLYGAARALGWIINGLFGH